MKKLKATTILAILAFLVVSLPAKEDNVIDKTFEAKKAVKIVTITANCTVTKTKMNEVKVRLPYSDMLGVNKPVISEEKDTLIIREKVPASERASGADWQVWIPRGTRLEFSTASGEITTENLKGDISANSASGEINISGGEGKVEVKSMSGGLQIRNHSGDVYARALNGDIEGNNLTGGSITLKSTSGDLHVENLKGGQVLKVLSGDIILSGGEGNFKMTSASGDIEASNIKILGPSEFKVASGNIMISLAGSAAHDISIASATGNAVLDYNGHPVKGYFEFKARANSGDIVCPFAFDKEEEVFKHGSKYILKSFKKGGTAPKITIQTATGKAVLKK